MRRAAWALIALLGCSVFLIACGGGYSSTGTTPTTSGLTNRAFISNQFSSALDIVDASNDKMSTHRVIVDVTPTIMALSPNKKATLVFASGANLLDVVDNKGEAVGGKLQTPDKTESFFYLPDNKTIYVAVRNSGIVIAWDTSSTSVPPSVVVPNVRWIAHSNSGKTVLAFPDDNSNSLYVIDTTASPPTVSTAIGGFDHPVGAVFSSDDSVAYVLNCGPECGGTTASIQVLNLPAQTLGANVAVPGGATEALLSGTTLYIAGTPQPAPACLNNVNSTCGRLSVMTVNGGTLSSPSASYEIADGFHDHILSAPSNRLFIGSEFTCNAMRPNGNGCLSIFNTSANTVATPIVCGPSCNGLADVTGMTVIPHRTNIVYVVEGGEVHVYDASTDAQLPGVSIDTSGRSWDVVAPD